jgi:hypothetical protein
LIDWGGGLEALSLVGFFRRNILHALLRVVTRCARVLICCRGVEVVSKVVLRLLGCSAGANAHRDCDGRERDSDKAKRRDGKEDVHACLEKDNKCVGFLQLIRSGREI